MLDAVKIWAQAVRDKEFLVELQLRNLEHRPKLDAQFTVDNT